MKKGKKYMLFAGREVRILKNSDRDHREFFTIPDLKPVNLLLTEREGRTGEYWPEVVIVRTSLRSVRTKTTEGQYSPLRLEQARLVSSLLYGTGVMPFIFLLNALPDS